MRIISRKTLRDFVESLRGSKDQKAVKSALDSWFHEVQGSDWHTPAEVTGNYANASIVGNDRVVFNIKGQRLQAGRRGRLSTADRLHQMARYARAIRQD